MNEEMMILHSDLKALMEVCAGTWELNQIYSAFTTHKRLDVTGDELPTRKLSGFGNFNQIVGMISEATLSKLTIDVSLMVIDNKDTINIHGLLRYSILNVHLYETEEKEQLIKTLNEFQSQLEGKKDIILSIIKVRNKLLAHLDKQEIRQNRYIGYAFQNLGVDWSSFYSELTSLMVVCKDILNFLNHSLPTNEQMEFDITEAKEAHEHMTQLLDKI